MNVNFQADRRFLQRNHVRFMKFLDDYFPNESRKTAFDYLYWTYPEVGHAVVRSHFGTNKEKIIMMLDEIFSSTKIIYIGGARRVGKSAVGSFLAYHAKKRGFKVYYYMIFKKPYFAELIFDLSKCEQPSFVVIDEASITSSSRDSMKGYNEALTRLIPVLGHKKMWFVVISQHSAMTDINFLRLVDIKIFKPMSDDMILTERENVIKHPAIELLLPSFVPGQDWTDEILYVYRNNYIRLTTPLPNFWTDELSRSFSDIDEKKGIEYAYSLFHTHSWPVKQISTQLRNYGIKKSDDEWESVFSKLSSVK